MSARTRLTPSGIRMSLKAREMQKAMKAGVEFRFIGPWKSAGTRGDVEMRIRRVLVRLKVRTRRGRGRIRIRIPFDLNELDGWVGLIWIMDVRSLGGGRIGFGGDGGRMGTGGV